MGLWADITPKGLSRRHANAPWVFALYRESPAERSDSRYYECFLFRDEAFEHFGLIERPDWTSVDAHRERAARIVVDAEYRRRFYSDAPWLTDLWNRRSL